jgi:uncharacterized protein (TIGR03435 family)
MTAYNLRAYQFTPPDWMRESWFQIDANIPAGSTKEQMRQMEQNLLAERFKLAVHFVKKEDQIYEMTVGADGVKFKEWADLPPLARPVTGPVKAADLRPAPDSPAEWQFTDGRHSRRGKHSMDFLAAYLSGQLERPVLDATGLTGEYDIMLDYVMEPRRLAFMPAPPEVSLAAGATLVKAVESQLGLRMESKKGMIDMFVIDHVEKIPTEN